MGTVSGNTLGASYCIQQPSDRPSYVITFNATPTTQTDLAVVEAPAAPFSGVIRVQRIFIGNPGAQTTAGLVTMRLVLTGTAGTGGVVTAVPIDPLSPAYTGICRTNDTSLGSETQTIAGDYTLYVPATTPGAFSPVVIEMGGQGLTYQQPCCRAGQGVAFRHPGAAGATDFSGYMVFTVDPS